jgi:hypothetical protein
MKRFKMKRVNFDTPSLPRGGRERAECPACNGVLPHFRPVGKLPPLRHNDLARGTEVALCFAVAGNDGDPEPTGKRCRINSTGRDAAGTPPTIPKAGHRRRSDAASRQSQSAKTCGTCVCRFLTTIVAESNRSGRKRECLAHGCPTRHSREGA